MLNMASLAAVPQIKSRISSNVDARAWNIFPIDRGNIGFIQFLNDIMS